MNANLTDAVPSRKNAAPSRKNAAPASPVYFSSAERTLFGWVHAPGREPAADFGVVICKPFGYEALCAHRGVTAFADAISATAVPVLRFDYAGTGDSSDIDCRANQIETWVRDISSAVAELRRRTGVRRVYLLGFRLGALLAAVAARETRAISGLVLIAPVVSGGSYVREARTLQLAAAAAEASAAQDCSLKGQCVPDGLEVAGYSLSAASLAALSSLDVRNCELESVSDLLIIDRNDLPGAKTWTDLLRQRGHRVDYHAMPGFVEMMLTTAYFAKVPQGMLQATCDWFRRQAAGSQPASPRERSDFTQPPVREQTSLHLPAAGSCGASIVEKAVFLSAETGLFGIVSHPRKDEVRRRAVILLNTGADSHVGACDLSVVLARRWARRGYFVLRMDLSGLGDSDTRPGQVENEVFPPEALEDIGAAIGFMRGQYEVREITLAGVCSGAFHALRAAVAGLPVQRILMVNPQNYFWRRGGTLGDLQPVEIVRNPKVYKRRILSPSAWRRLLSGKVEISRILKIYMRRPLLAIESVFRDVARSFGVRLRRDLGRELEDIVGRGIRVVFVFARGEPGLDLLKIEAGTAIRRLGELCRIRIIDSGDHTFTRRGPRKILEDVLSEELFLTHRQVDSTVVSGSAGLRSI